MGLRGPWLWRTQRQKQLPAGLPRPLACVCTRTSKETRLVEQYDSADLTEVTVCESRTHLAVALKVQEHPEVRQGPDKVGNIIRLRGLERPATRIPFIANFRVAFAGWFPFVFL